jgi:jumonji domain-containing protein 7
MQKGEEGVIAINYWYDMDYSNMLYPTMALYRRLFTGIMENNRDLLKDEDVSSINSDLEPE